MEHVNRNTRIGDFFQVRILRYELTILSVFILCMILKLLNVPLSGIIVTLVLMTLAVIYFFSAFASPDSEEFSAIDIFFKKLIGLGSSISLIGVLFLIQHWPNGRTMITVGIITMTACMAHLIYHKIKTPEIEKFSTLVIVRLTILTIVSIGVLYLGI